MLTKGLKTSKLLQLGLSQAGPLAIHTS